MARSNALWLSVLGSAALCLGCSGSDSRPAARKWACRAGGGSRGSGYRVGGVRLGRPRSCCLTGHPEHGRGSIDGPGP